MEDENPPQTFIDFMLLPEVLQIKIMSSCAFKTKLHFSETCTHLHHLLWSSPKLSGRIRLNVRSFVKKSGAVKDLELIKKNQKRGRKYTRVKIYQFSSTLSETEKEKLIEISIFLGDTVKDLTIDMGKVKNEDIVKLLRCFPLLEKLMFDGFMEAEIVENAETLDTSGILYHLKHLNVDFPSSEILKVVENIDTLKSFTFQNNKPSLDFSYGIQKLEDFIIKQHRLKELKVYGMEAFPLFESNRIDEISFQLENLFAVCFFIHRHNVQHFFKHQRSIQNLHLINFFNPETYHMDRPNYTNVLHVIFMLPKLQTIIIGHGRTILPEDFEIIGDIRNTSVKSIEYIGRNSLVVENFFNIFPNIEKLQFDGIDLHFSRLPIENLERITSTRALKFSFTPPKVDVSIEEFEESLISFIKRHRKIEALVVGHKDWIGTSFGLSLNFLSQIVDILEDLHTIEIFNPLELTESLLLLNNVYSHKLHI